MEKKVTKKNTSKKVEKKTTKVKKEMPERRKANIRIIQEGNKYAKPLSCLLLVVLILIIAYLIYGSVVGKSSDKITYTQDEINFKKEFEALNNDSLVDVTIPEDNNITYINIDKLLELFDNGDGIVLFGNAEDNNTRSAVNFVIEAVNKNKVNNLYYFDTKDFRDEYKIENNKSKLVSAGGEGYREVLAYLDGYLDDYVLINSKGKEVKVGEKRLNIPTVVAIDNGEIADLFDNVGSVDDYDALVKEYLK